MIGIAEFLQMETWGDGRVVHGFGMRSRGGEKPNRKDWMGKDVQVEKERFPLVSLRQVHGDRVVVFDGISRKVGEVWQEEGDSLITRTPGLALGVFTADCLPIFLYDSHQQAIGVIHSGWRGTAKGVAGKAVGEMKARFRCREENIRAALGPCIGPCCYEVDSPVKKAFEDGGFPWKSISSPGGEGKWFLDLRRANSLMLEASGVRKENIEVLKACTSCRRDIFYSYRNADKTGGRQLNFIALRKVAGGRKTAG